MRMNRSSPAKRLPKSRSPRLSGFAISSMRVIATFTGKSQMPNGWLRYVFT